MKSVDYGVVVGAGVGFTVAGKLLTLGARYNHGLTKIAEDTDVKNRVISIVATFEFPWGK